jgi:hypothetical protein
MTTQHIHEAGHAPDRKTLMNHIVNEHDDIPVDDLYAAIRKRTAMGLNELHDAQHPVDRPATVRFKWYLHDDGVDGLEDFLTDPPPRSGQAPLPVALAREIAQAKPFYEVTVTVDYDTVAKKFTIIEAK